jgi:glc operon protein GlcG
VRRGSFSAPNAPTRSHAPMRQKPSLQDADAARMIAAARAAATANGWAVSIAVVDDGGYLLRLERLDGSVAPSPEVATLKARSAALARTPTLRLEEVAKARPGALGFPGRLSVQGGLPIMHDGECVGGIGVSGVQSAEDEQIAAAGLAAL